MAEPHYPPTVHLLQLQDNAPSIAKLLLSGYSRIHATIHTHDVQGHYGLATTYQVKAEVWRSRCRLCGESDDSYSVTDCARHRYESGWHAITETENQRFDLALADADDAVKLFLEKNGTESKSGNGRSSHRMAGRPEKKNYQSSLCAGNGGVFLHHQQKVPRSRRGRRAGICTQNQRAIASHATTQASNGAELFQLRAQQPLYRILASNADKIARRAA